jgi:hypothetical protein
MVISFSFWISLELQGLVLRETRGEDMFQD